MLYLIVEVVDDVVLGIINLVLMVFVFLVPMCVHALK